MPDPERPAYHLTVPTGWLNDPHGVTWRDGRYVLFFQYNPDAPAWATGIRWGRVEGPDLVRWSAPEIALTPSGGDEAGCWTGCVVDDGDSTALLYTSAVAATPDLGRIVLARSGADRKGWRRDPGGPVLAGPPPGPAVTVFRDPSVFRYDGRWRMVVGGGLSPSAGALFHYTAEGPAPGALDRWHFDGVACAKPADGAGPRWTGAVWECPQLFPLDGAWVLLVSVWQDGVLHHVAGAVGEYDGAVFAPRRWQRLTYGGSLYAATAFQDAAGRRALIAWSRDPAGPRTAGWAGALSLPYLIGREGDRLTLTPHPDVATLRSGVRHEVSGTVGAVPLELAVGPARQHDLIADVELPDPDGRLTIDLHPAGRAGPPGPGDVSVLIDRAADTAVLRTGTNPDDPASVAVVPLGADRRGRATVRLLTDHGIVELGTGAGALGCVRLVPPAEAGPMVVTVTSGQAVIHGLTVHLMSRP